MSLSIELPDYRDQPKAIASRFSRIYDRPVVLDVQGLGKTFESSTSSVEALRDINLEVHRREFICVIGPSGCGKSTLIRILAGLEHPSSGKVLLDGEEVHGPGPGRGMVFQGYTLFPWLTVKGNVMFGRRMAGLPEEQAEAEALEWIEVVGLARCVDSYPYQLSGGMKQRVAIARALANKPRIMLMDEPFGALDAQTRAQMQSHILQIWQNVDVTILFITHDLDEAVYLADRIVVLDSHPGQVLEVIEVPVPHPRSKEQFLDPYFLATRRRIEELIHPDAGNGTDHLPLSRNLAPGDEVF